MFFRPGFVNLIIVIKLIMLNSPIDEIKVRLNVVDVVGSYIKLKKAGTNYRALCPFHSEKTPSFFVSPARQIWHCFGCNTGGDIFRFIMQIEGIEFGDALRMLAQKAGVELKPRGPEYAELRTERKRLYEICELAAKFFEKQLEGSKGKEVKEYLLSRGINEESIRKWRLGWSSESWSGLSDFLVKKGYKKEEIEKTGLALKNEQGSYYDRFRARIIFPVLDFNGQVIGFGGRVLQKTEGVAKYINSPATLLYDKSRVLYGLDKAKVEIRKKDFCILVEGYTDTILAQQSGAENTVSSSGTALTSYQLVILKRYTENLYLAFDMDIAGDAATKRGIDLAQVQGFNIKVINLPEGKDPADIISKDSGIFEKLVESALSILDFYFQSAFSKFDKNTPEGKREISKILLPPIKRIPNKIEQSFWVQKLAKEIGAREKDVEEELEKVRLEASEPEPVPETSLPPVIQKSRKDLLEERMLTLLLKSPQFLSCLDQKFVPSCSEKVRQILENFQDQKNFSGEITEFINCLALKAEIEEIEEKDIVPEIQFCLKEIQLIETRNKLGGISKELKKAEQEQNPEQITKLTQEFNQKAKEII